MYKKSKRFLAGFLALLLTVTMVPADMFGAIGVVNAAGTELQESMITLADVTDGKVTYTGSEIKPGATVAGVDDTDEYDVSYDAEGDYVNVGAGKKVIVTPKVEEDNDENTALFGEAVTVTFEIVAFELKDTNVTLKDVEGSNKKDVEVTFNGNTLTDDDYTVSYKKKSDSSAIGDSDWADFTGNVVVTVEGKGNFTGTVEKEYTVASVGGEKTDLSDGKASVTAEGVAGAEPTVTVKYDGTELTKGTDYTVAYKKGDNTVAVADIAKDDEITVVVTGTGDYEGEVTGTYTATEAGGGDAKTDLSDGKATVEAEGVAGAEPTVTVKYDGTALTKGTDYTVAYKKGDNTVAVADIAKDDEITVVVTGTGDYTGEVTGTYTATEAGGGDKVEYATYMLNISNYNTAGTHKIKGDDNSEKEFILTGSKSDTPAGDYTKGWKLNNGASIAFNASAGTIVEVLCGNKDANTWSLGIDGVEVLKVDGTVNKDDSKITAVSKTDYSAASEKTYILTATLGTDGSHTIARSLAKEFFVYYVKVKEPSSGASTAVDLATITPILNATTVPYTGSAVTAPTVTVPDVAAADYTVKYARKTGDSDPADADYKEAAEAELVELGTVYVKAFAKTSGYKNATKAVTFEIGKGAAPTVDKKEIPVNISTASDEQKAAHSMPQEIDLSSEFTFDSKYGTPTFKDARIADPADAANNVLAEAPALSIEGGKLKFNSKTELPEEAQVAATIKVDAEFEKYETAVLTIEVTLASKETVTITGVTFNEKTYDGTAIEPVLTGLKFKTGEGDDAQEVTVAEADRVFTYAEKDGGELDGAPADAGTYTLVVSVASGNGSYTGSSDPFEFEIKQAPLTIKANDRSWKIGRPAPAAKGSADWYEVTGLVNNETLADLEAEPTFTYKKGDADVSDWTTVTTEDTIVIVPALELKNYAVTAQNGTLTVIEGTQLGEGEHELDLMDWELSDGKYRYGAEKALTDGYFTLSANTPAKTASATNSYNLITYNEYEHVLKMNGDGEVSFTAPEGSKLEIIAHIQKHSEKTNLVSVDGSFTVTTAGGTVAAQGDATVEFLGDGTIAEPKSNTAPEDNKAIHKITVTLGAGTNGKHTIVRGNGNEFQLYYIKVTEPKTETVSVTPTISEADLAKLDGAKVYLTATGESDIEVGTSALTLKKNVTYTLVVKNADGSESDTLEARINGLLSYKAEDNDSVTIVISNKGEEPPVETAKIKPTISDPDKKLGEASVYFVTTDKTEKVRVIDGQEVELVIGTEYRLVVLDLPEGINLKATINDSNTYKATGNANVTITIAEVPVVKYKVTLADETGKAIKTEEIEEGKEFTFPDATNKKDGYFFAGWTAEDEERAFGKGETIIVEYDITFRETWVQAGKEDFTVKFYDYYENEIPNLAKTIKAGESPVITLPEAASKRVGYVFRGWYDSEYGNLYTAGATYTVIKNVSFSEYWEEEDLPETGMVVRINEDEAYYQGGKAVTPYVYVYYKGNDLSLGTDYTVKYKNNKNAGTATVTVTGKGNYAKAVKKDISFTIRRRNVEDLDYAYEMTVIKDAKFTPVILCNGKVLKAGKDYDLSDETKKEDGTKAESGFDAAKCRYTKVTDKAVTNDKGEVTTPAKYNTLVVKGKGNYTGTAEIYITVIDKTEAKTLGVEIDKTFKPVFGDNISWGELFGENKTTEDGKTEFKVGKVKVFDKKDSAKTALDNEKFMVVDVSGSIRSAGTYKFMIVGMGEYSGSVTKTIKVSPKKATDIKAGVEEYDFEQSKWVFKTTGLSAEYNSYGATLPLTVRREYEVTEGTDKYTRTETLSNGYDYKVSYSGNKKVGNAKAKISFINDYKGTAPITVEFAVTGASLNHTYAIVPDMTYTKAGKSYVSKPIVEYNNTILKAAEYEAHYAWVSVKDKNAEKDIDWTKATSDDKVKITIADGDSYAKVRVEIKPNAKKSNFVLSKDNENKDISIYEYYYVRKADNAIDLSKAKVTFYSDPECKTQYKKIPFRDVEFWTPEGNEKLEEADESAVYVKVEVNKKVVDAKLYDVTWLCASNKGKATVVITGKGPSDTGTTVTPAPTPENSQAEESSAVDGSGSPTSPATGATYAVGGKTVTVAIDSIGGWIEPKKAAEKAMNFLKKLF